MPELPGRGLMLSWDLWQLPERRVQAAKKVETNDQARTPADRL